jgi:hypothetical protein
VCSATAREVISNAGGGVHKLVASAITELSVVYIPPMSTSLNT